MIGSMRYRWICLLLLALCVSAQYVSGQKRPMDFDDVMKLKSPGSPQISPDGRWVVYTVSTPDLKEDLINTNLWLVAADGSSSPRQLTRHTKADTQPRWSP